MATPGEPGADLDPDILEEMEFWGDDADHDGHEAGAQRADDVATDHSAADPAAADQGPATAASSGALVVVGTPIGNLGDLSPRAVRALADADTIYCEDTRHSRKLLSHAGISGVPLRSLHEHNELDRIDEVVAAVAAGKSVAIVSDAGMPGVSDPGSRVVAAVAGAGLVVTVVPGPSAVLAALVASGLPTDRFVFEGFLPRGGRERRARIAEVAAEPRTTVLFEAPGRVAGTLGDLAEACGGDRAVAVARELTKLHEELWRGSLSDAVSWAETPIRGEVVLVLDGAPEPAEVLIADHDLSAALAERLGAGERTRGAVDEVAAAFGVPRRRVYDLALAARAEGEPPPRAPE